MMSDKLVNKLKARLVQLHSHAAVHGTDEADDLDIQAYTLALHTLEGLIDTAPAQFESLSRGKP